MEAIICANLSETELRKCQERGVSHWIWNGLSDWEYENFTPNVHDRSTGNRTARFGSKLMQSPSENRLESNKV
uniref:Uncharacterized protein n=1 Tax=Caenorhabditis japonica TaxID=281687 RepID=A0A8R1HNS2_CAEJA